LKKSDSVVDISVDLIDEPVFQVREFVAEDKLEELMTSIKTYGVIEPIIVEKADSRYRVIAGNLRLMACRRLSLPTVPCIVREFSKKDKYMVALQENIMRSDMSPVELASALRKLKEEFKLKNTDIAELVGKSQGWVSNHFQILEADDEIKEAVEKGQIDLTSGNTLMRLSPKPLRMRYLEFCLKGGATQSQVREWVAKELGKRPTESTPTQDLTSLDLPEMPPPLTFNCSCCKREIDQNRRIDLELCGECYDLVNEMIKAVRKGGSQGG